MAEPSCSSKITKKKEVNLILLLATSTAKFRNMYRKTTSPQTCGKRFLNKSPSKCLDSGNHKLLLPNDLEKIFNLQGYLRRGIPWICMNILQTQLISRFGRTNSISSKIPTSQIRTIFMNNFSLDNSRS